MAHKVRILGVVIVAVLVFGAAPVAHGSMILSFEPDPASPTTAEFVYDGTTLGVGPGADPTLGSLHLVSPYGGPFAGASLTLMGLADLAPTVTYGFYGATGFVQPLGSGTFTFMASDKITTLLTGTIDSAMIAGILSNAAGGVLTFDAAVKYTGGTILAASPYKVDDRGEFSWSLLLYDGATFGLDGSSQLLGFDANGVGQFNITVPEPAAMSLLALGAVAVLRRRKKQMTTE